MTDEADDLVLLRGCADNIEAATVRSLLASRGIQCSIPGETHRGMLGVMGAFVELRILVRRGDLQAAEELLAAETVAEALPEAGGPAHASLEGAVCPVHELPAQWSCARCGTFLCGSCAPSEEEPDRPGAGKLCEECDDRSARSDPIVASNRKRLVAGAMLFWFIGVPLLVVLAFRLFRWH